MKSTLLMILLVAFALGIAAPAMAQDKGAPDTLVIIASRPDLSLGDSTFFVEAYYWADSQAIDGITAGWGWDDAAVQLDSAKVGPGITTIFDLTRTLFLGGSIATSNDSMFFMIGFSKLFGGGITDSLFGTRVHLATWYFTVTDWSTGWDLSSMITVDTLSYATLAGTKWKAAAFDGSDIFPVWPYGTDGLALRDASDATDLGDPELPKEFSLAQNYPNPFNPTTTINFNLPVRSEVRLDIYNLLGQRVTTLKDEEMQAGSYSVVWDGTSDGGNKVASGIYFYKLETSQFSDTKKMILLK